MHACMDTQSDRPEDIVDGLDSVTSDPEAISSTGVSVTASLLDGLVDEAAENEEVV